MPVEAGPIVPPLSLSCRAQPRQAHVTARDYLRLFYPDVLYGIAVAKSNVSLFWHQEILARGGALSRGCVFPEHSRRERLPRGPFSSFLRSALAATPRANSSAKCGSHNAHLIIPPSSFWSIAPRPRSPSTFNNQQRTIRTENNCPAQAPAA